MLELRPYQHKTIDVTRQGFINHLRQLMVLPTGGGKTVVFAYIACSAARKGTKVLILTDRTELHDQTVEAIRPFNVPLCEINQTNKRVEEMATVFIGMVETFKRRIEQFKKIPFGLIVVDEAHVGNFNRVFDEFPNIKVIGATATPEGTHLYKYYTNIIQEIDTPELVDLGFLVDCKPFQMQDDFSDLETKAGEYTDASQMNHFDKPKLYSGVVDQWKLLASGTKTLCFNVNIKHTIKTHESFVAAGISSEYVTSHTETYERDRILRAFSNGDFQVLNNCGILTKGYNEPSIETIIMNRATKSLNLFLQCAGRGSRTYPGKTHFTFLDFGMNHDRHGLWNESRTWKIKKPREPREGVAPVKTCGNDECGCLVSVSARECKFCGYIFPIAETRLSEGVMVEVGPKAPARLVGMRISKLDLPALLELESSKKYKSSFIWRVIRARGEPALKEWALAKGYSKGWLYRQLQDAKNDSMNQFTDYIIR